jgi:phosphoribosylformylglycinamidine synthase
MVVAEAVMNLACVGARPLALVNCLNFGNPEHPEVMWQLSEAIDGMAEACRALELPVVGGNVSLYNESNGVDIDPSPVIGVLGLREELAAVPPGPALVDGHVVLVVGAATGGATPLGGSLWARARHRARGGHLPGLDIASVACTAALLVDLVVDDAVSGVHDISDGGLGLCLAEMVARSGVGLVAADVADHVAVFHEAPGRAVVCVPAEHADDLEARAAAAGVSADRLGVAGGDRLRLGDTVDLAVTDVVAAWEGSRL